MRSSLLRVLLIAGALTVCKTPAKAAFINTIDRGWYTYYGGHSSGNQNYVAGLIGGGEYRNYFVFDLSGITNPLISASLRVYTFDMTAAGAFTLFNVSTPITSLTGGTGGVAAFNDLGTGMTLGTSNLSLSDDHQYVTISLNTDALAYLNNHLGGTVALGGRYDSTGYAFGSSQGYPSSVTRLEYQINPVPAPASAMLLGIGLTSLAGFRAARRRRTTSSPRQR